MNTEEFIKCFSRERMTPEEKIRFAQLYAKEIVSQRKSNKTDSSQDLVALVHEPLKLVRILHKFTEDGGKALKYTTHTWNVNTKQDEGYWEFKDYDSFVEKYTDEIKKDIRTITYKYNEHLGFLLHSFLLRKEPLNKGWGKYGIKIGYQTPPDCMRKWMEEHPQKQPMSMPMSAFPEEFRPGRINGNTIGKFDEIVGLFKSSIEFRGNSLYDLVREIGRSSDIELNKESLQTLQGVTFYTDTLEFENALNIIFKNIKQRPEYPYVDVSAELSVDSTYYKIVINHKGSFSDAPINKDKLKLDGGEMVEIKKRLRCLCDWFVESRFYDPESNTKKNYRITYLEDSDFSTAPKFQEIPNSDGFKHIFKFYL